MSECLERGEADEILGKMKVSAMLEALPGVGKVRAQKVMEELNISPQSSSARAGRQAEARTEGTVRQEVARRSRSRAEHPTLTVGGLPGTGTTTLCRLFERSLELPYIYAGQLFREEAARAG